MEQRGERKSFGPVYAPGAKALVLGSYPSPKSFDSGFNYGHPQNRFWPLMALLTGRPLPTSVAEKRALVLASGLALWDSLESCTITGASDASIADPVPNDVAGLCKRLSIQAVFCNGAASYKYYRLFNERAAGIPGVKLPSTSPANAAWSLPRLAEAWGVLRPYLNPQG